MATREELVSKWKNKGQTVSTVPVTDVLSPVQDLTKYNRLPTDLANKLSIQKTIPTPTFAQKEIQAPKATFKTKTTTPAVTTRTTGSVLRGAGIGAKIVGTGTKEAGSLFVDVLKSVPELRGQIESQGGKSGLYNMLGAAETSLGEVLKASAERKSIVPKSEGVIQQTVQNGLRELGGYLATAGEEDMKMGEMLAETMPKFAFSSKEDRPKAIAAGIVQNAPILLGGLLVGASTALVTKNPSATTATLLAYTSALEGGFAYREAKQLGADDAQARKLMVRVGLANGILETLPISRFLNRSMATRNVKKQILAKVAKDIAQAGFEEGTTEGLQEMVLNYAMQEVDKNRLLFQGVPESAFFGAILGGGIAGGKAAYDKAKADSGGKLRLGLSIEDVSIPEDKLKADSKNDFDLADNKIGYSKDGWKVSQVTEKTNGVTTVVREEKKVMDVKELPPELQIEYRDALEAKETAKGTGVENVVKAGRVFQNVVNKIADHLGLRAGAVSVPYTETGDLSTKLLAKLEGKTTVSKQFISDLTNSPDLKQAERDLIRRVLEDEVDKVNVTDFANKVKAELLPITAKDTVTSQKVAIAKLKERGYSLEQDMSGEANLVDKDGELVDYTDLDEDVQKLVDSAVGTADSYDKVGRPRYESVNLPSELRGPVANYKENIYESPIKTSAGGVHFSGDTQNYFAHTRVEDVPNMQDLLDYKADKLKGFSNMRQDTRRVIEIQSDLFQKGRLEGEMQSSKLDIAESSARDRSNIELVRKEEALSNEQVKLLRTSFRTPTQEQRLKDIQDELQDIETQKRQPALLQRQSELSRLEPYRNTWHERIIREEVKKAAQDGKTKLQFPTGETAMKIEGLGTQGDGGMMFAYEGFPIEQQQLKVGREIYSEASDQDWVITETLGGGKFRAIPKELADQTNPEALASTGRAQGEMFDISGEIDTNNPIYKFYEKEVGRYLKNKYNAQLVTDAQGVTWWELNVDPKLATKPTEAFKRGDKADYTTTLEELRAEMKRITGQDIPLFTVENFGSEARLGEMVKGIIRILQKGNKVSDFVGKHELWHLIKRGMVTAEERDTIEAMEIDLAKASPAKVQDLKDAGYTDEQVAEELMADEFARYYRTGNTFTEKIRVIYDKIIQRIELFLANKSEILTYFKTVRSKLTGEIKSNIKSAEFKDDSLYTEARGKSLEEFVKTQGTPVYHGGGKTFESLDDINFDEGFYMLKKTDSDLKKLENIPKGNYYSYDDLAKMPAEAFGGKVTDFVVNFKKPLVFDAKGKGWMELADDEISDFTARLVNKAKKQGNDGVIIKNIREGFSGKGTLGEEAGLVDDYIALDKDTIKTKSQLTDIWKEANKTQETPQVDETAIQQTAQDIEDAFAEVSSMIEISDYGQGGEIKEDTEGRKSRQKGIWPAFMPEDMHTKADVQLADELLSGKEAKTDRQKRLYQSILKFVSDKVGADRFTDYEYTQLLQKMSDEATAERKVFIDKMVADLKKMRRSLTPTEVRQAIKQSTEQEKSQVIQKRESTLLKDRIRTLARGYREGAKLGKDGVYETQSELIDLIEESGMTKEDRAGFIRTIRNVQTDEQLQKALPELQERIDRVVSETEKKQLRKEIIKVVKRVGDSPTVALEYKQRIQELISAFELKGHTKETIEKLQKARAFLTEQASQGKDIEIPNRLLSNLEILNRTPFDAIPVDTLRSVLEDIKFLEKLGRTKFRVKQEVYQYEKDNILQEIKDGSQPLNKSEVVVPKAGERLSKSQKFKNYVNSVINQFARIDKVISPMDVVLDTLDGAPGTYDGANFRNVKLRFDRDFNAYLQQKYQLQDPVHVLADKYNFDERNYTRIGLVAAREQSGGPEKLLNNGYTQEEIDAVELTPQERELLELMKTQMDSLFPVIQQVQKDVYNLDVKKVDNYFSFMTDWSLMDEAEVYLRMGPDVAEFGKNFQDVGDRVKSNIDPSFVKKRAGAGRQKIDINAMVVFMKHTDNTAYFLNFARDTKMMGEIVRSEEYKKAVGDLGQLLMLEYVDLISRQGGASGANQIAMLDWMRKNVSAGILGLKLSTVAIQWTAVIDGMGFIGPVYGSAGINSFVTDKALRDMVLTFPEMRERVGGETALEELKNSDSWLTDIQKKGFIPLQKVDMVAAGSVTLGAYMQKMDAMGKQIDPNNINKEAMEYAQLALRRTQSSSLFKDVPLAISRGSMTGNRSWDRAIFQFQTFLLTRWSRVRHDAIRVGITNKDPKQAINVLFWIMLSSVAATGTRMAVKGLTDMILDAEPPEEDEDKMPYWQSSLIRELAGTVPFMGNLMGSYMYDSAFMPILDTPQNAMEGAKKMFEGVQPQTKARGFIEFSTSIGAMFGVPGSIQVQQVLKGMVEPANATKTEREKILDKYKRDSTKSERDKIMDKYR